MRRDPDEDDDATARLPRSDRAGSPVFRPTGSPPDRPAAVPAEPGSPPFASIGAGPADSGPGDSSDIDSTAGAGSAGAGAASASAGGDSSASGRNGPGTAAAGGPGGSRPAWQRLAGVGDASGAPAGRQRRRRQWFVAGISIGAALVVIALCAGALAVVDAVSDVKDSASEARETREIRDQSCLELERRLNRLNPPGAAPAPPARAVAIRDENAAVRIYVGEINEARAQDGWRQLLDARAVYADALDRQAKARTPAFYVPPRNVDDEPLAGDLVDWSPAPCAGPIRRLAAPDL